MVKGRITLGVWKLTKKNIDELRLKIYKEVKANHKDFGHLSQPALLHIISSPEFRDRFEIDPDKIYGFLKRRRR